MGGGTAVAHVANSFLALYYYAHHGASAVKIHLIAVGTGMPSWIAEGWREYAQRLGGAVTLALVELPAGRRAKSADVARLRAEEGERLLAAVPDGAWVVALDERGKSWSSRDLARRLDSWMMDGRDVALLVGGADGLDPAVLARADLRWSLSALTLPHMLVRVVVAEQVYRAWTLRTGHPYHR